MTGFGEPATDALRYSSVLITMGRNPDDPTKFAVERFVDHRKPVLGLVDQAELLLKVAAGLLATARAENV